MPRRSAGFLILLMGWIVWELGTDPVEPVFMAMLVGVYGMLYGLYLILTGWKQ